MKTDMQIIGIGACIPLYRIKKEEYIKAWGSFQAGISEKSVLGYDEDVVTMAVEAGQNALRNSGVNPNEITSISVASISPPYSLRSMAAEVSMALGLPRNMPMLDFKESEKAGTTALIAAIDITENRDGFGLVIASDAPRARPNDEEEHGLGAGAAAFVIGKKEGIAKIEGHSSAMIPFIADRFQKTGEDRMESLSIPGYHKFAYQKCVQDAVNTLLTELQLKETDFQHVIIQARNRKEPRIFKSFLNLEKVSDTILNTVGDIASASTPLGLVHALETRAKANDRILCISYGASAGSDAISIFVNKQPTTQPDVPSLETYLERKKYLSYDRYLRFREYIQLE
ncbi:MAG: hydroxymethylglutaryl-CoA synthase [Candidatus Helarchaeales archaeon]